MISVCMATYNGAKYLSAQLSSILSQLSPADEVVIADDGSTDGTLQIISDFADPRIKLIDGAHRHSPIWSFEKALGVASGDYIFLSDQDDVWTDDKVSITMNYLADYDCVVSDSYVVNDDMSLISDSFYRLNNTNRGKYYNLICKNGYLGCCMAFQRAVLSKVLPFPTSISMHDMWIGNVAAFSFKMKFIDNQLIYYRRHKNNVSTAGIKSKTSFLKRARYRLSIILPLCRVLLRDCGKRK